MDYEHDNELGQGANRESFIRENRRQSQGANPQRSPAYREGQGQMSRTGTDSGRQEYRNPSVSRRQGYGDISSSGRQGRGDTSSSGRQGREDISSSGRQGRGDTSSSGRQGRGDTSSSGRQGRGDTSSSGRQGRTDISSFERQRHGDISDSRRPPQRRTSDSDRQGRQEMPGSGRQMQGEMSGSRRTGYREMPSSERGRQMQGRSDEMGTIRRPASSREDSMRTSASRGRNSSARTAAVSGSENMSRAMRETAAGKQVAGSRSVNGGARSSGARSSTAKTVNENSKVVQAKYERARLKKRRMRIIAMIVAECFTLAFIFGYAYFARRFNMIQREDFDPKEVENKEISLDTTKKMKGYRMFAIFGVDSRDNNVGAGCQSDVNMICCINEDTGEIRLVSVYRDTYLNINDQGSYRKFNAAYTNGGPEQALRALNKNLDLNITQYVTFSWKSVADGINILGGVDLEVTNSEFKYINGFITETVNATGVGSYQLRSPGFQHLDGVQAVAYGRLRLMDTDFARTERQRKIIELAFAKAKQADYSVLNNILVVILPSISTNISFADMTTLALGINKYYIGETAGFPFAKGNLNIPGKGDCVIPQTLVSNVSQLHTFLFGDEEYDPTEQVKNISSKIATDSGMYREGKVSTASAAPTDSSVSSSVSSTAPKETTKAVSTETETTTKETETTEREKPKPSETSKNGTVIEEFPGVTDDSGELIDGPIDDWPEEPDILPSGSQQNSPANSGTITPTQTGVIGRPNNPSESSENFGPGGTGTQTGVNGSQQTVAPSGAIGSTNPAGTTTNPGGTTPSGTTVNPAGTTPSGTAANPGGTTPSGTTVNPAGTTPSGTATNPGGTTSSGTIANPGGTAPGGSNTNPGNSAPGNLTPEGNTTPNSGNSSPGGNSTVSPGTISADAPGSGNSSQNNDTNGPVEIPGNDNQPPQGPGL